MLTRHRVLRKFEAIDGSLHENQLSAERKNIEIELWKFLAEGFPKIDNKLLESISVSLSSERSRVNELFRFDSDD